MWRRIYRFCKHRARRGNTCTMRSFFIVSKFAAFSAPSFAFWFSQYDKASPRRKVAIAAYFFAGVFKFWPTTICWKVLKKMSNSSGVPFLKYGTEISRVAELGSLPTVRSFTVVYSPFLSSCSSLAKGIGGLTSALLGWCCLGKPTTFIFNFSLWVLTLCTMLIVWRFFSDRW